MENRSSWSVFFISIGLLFIMFSPKFAQPIFIIIGGLLIIFLAIIKLNKIKREDRRGKNR